MGPPYIYVIKWAADHVAAVLVSASEQDYSELKEEFSSLFLSGAAYDFHTLSTEEEIQLSIEFPYSTQPSKEYFFIEWLIRDKSLTRIEYEEWG